MLAMRSTPKYPVSGVLRRRGTEEREMKLASWAATDQGRTRKNNEDHYRIAPDLGFVAVADGMGGFERGEVASELACNVLRESIAARSAILDTYRESPTEENRLGVLALAQALRFRAEPVSTNNGKKQLWPHNEKKVQARNEKNNTTPLEPF